MGRPPKPLPVAPRLNQEDSDPGEFGRLGSTEQKGVRRIMGEKDRSERCPVVGSPLFEYGILEERTSRHGGVPGAFWAPVPGGKVLSHRKRNMYICRSKWFKEFSTADVNEMKSCR